MDHDFLVVISDRKCDRRSEYLSTSLKKKEGARVWDGEGDAGELNDPVVILPFFIADKKAAEILGRIPDGSRVFGGYAGEESELVIKRHRHRYFNILTDGEFAAENALITAEGALALVINSTDSTLSKMRVAVFGFGRIGQRLTRMLLAMGATVKVYTSNEEELLLAKRQGVAASHLWMRDDVGLFKAVVNTVPLHHVIDADTLSKLDKDVYLLDLASGENNVDWNALRTLSLKGERVSSLPAKVSPRSAALAIEKTIFRNL